MRITVHCLSLSPDLMSLAGLRAVVPFSFVVFVIQDTAQGLAELSGSIPPGSFSFFSVNLLLILLIGSTWFFYGAILTKHCTALSDISWKPKCSIFYLFLIIYLHSYCYQPHLWADILLLEDARFP